MVISVSTILELCKSISCMRRNCRGVFIHDMCVLRSGIPPNGDDLVRESHAKCLKNSGLEIIVIAHPKYLDPSKVAILRTQPLRTTGSFTRNHWRFQ